MHREHSCQRFSGNLFSTAKNVDKKSAARSNFWYFSANLGGKKGELIPWKEIAGKTESEAKHKEHKTAYPHKFPWFPVSLHEEGAEHVDEGHQNHRVG